MLFRTTGNDPFLFFQMMVLRFVNIAKTITWERWINAKSGFSFSSIETHVVPKSTKDPYTDSGPQANQTFLFNICPLPVGLKFQLGWVIWTRDGTIPIPASELESTPFQA